MRRVHTRHAGFGNSSSGTQCRTQRKRGHGRDRRRALPLHRLPQDHQRHTGCSLRQESRNRRPRPATRWARGWCGSTVAAKWTARKFLAQTRFRAERWWFAPSAALTNMLASVSAISMRFVAAHPGIHRVLTARDIPGENRYGVIPRFADQPVFAEVEARFRGEAVAAVVGEAEAIEALDLASFPVTWEELTRTDYDCGRACRLMLNASTPTGRIMFWSGAAWSGATWKRPWRNPTS